MPSRPSTPRDSIKKLFEPESVAVIGASPTNQWSRQGLENFKSAGFSGPVGAVNPRYTDILGYPCAPSIADLPFVPDAVLVSVNNSRVVDVIQDAADSGVKAAVVLAIGFAEIGGEGKVRQEELVRVARNADMAVLGPNCQGLVNFVHRTPLYMGPVSEYEAGSVALMSQSGSVTTALANNVRGIRWSHVVSLGNEAILDSADLLGYYLDDPSVSVVSAFLETIRDPERFFAECDRAREMGKPVVVLKSGRTEAAQKAAMAHSGALSAPDRLVDALFRRHGVIRVDSMEELLETTIAVQSSKRPSRGNLVSMTASGGQIELVLDETARTSLEHVPFSQDTKSSVRSLLPDFLDTTNPLDYWGMDDLDQNFTPLVKVVSEDDSCDVVVVVSDFAHGPTGGGGGVRQRESAAAVASESEKLVVVLDTVDGTVPAVDVESSLDDGVLLLSGLREGLRAIENLVSLSKPVSAAMSPRRFDVKAARSIIDAAPASFSGAPALALLDAVGITTPQMDDASDADEAVAVAERLGYPVVIKLGDPTALHKTESGGVHLNIRDDDAVRRSVAALGESGSKEFLIQQQVGGGVELLMGIQSDADLGMFILVGLGGIWTEVFDDVAIRPVGLRVGEAADMLETLRGYPLLTGVRGTPPVDLSAVVDAIERLDAFAVKFGGTFDSVDVNPLIALPDRAVAVDCLVVARSDAS